MSVYCLCGNAFSIVSRHIDLWWSTFHSRDKITLCLLQASRFTLTRPQTFFFDAKKVKGRGEMRNGFCAQCLVARVRIRTVHVYLYIVKPQSYRLNRLSGIGVVSDFPSDFVGEYCLVFFVFVSFEFLFSCQLFLVEHYCRSSFFSCLNGYKISTEQGFHSSETYAQFFLSVLSVSP